MKRMVTFFIVLLLLLQGTALAEKVVVPVWQDGGTVNVEMELYESAVGFSVAYDSARFVPGTELFDTIECLDAANAFIAFQSVTGWAVEDLAEGLRLQSGADDCTVDDSAVGGLFAEPIEATAVLYEEKAEGAAYQHSFFLVDRGADILQIECYYPQNLDEFVAAEFTAMMQTIELIDFVPTSSGSAQNGPKMVRCEVCGGWFMEGNEFRNHICRTETYPSEDAQMVQCEVCGGWFKEGNEFRNHICQVETYPSEDAQMVQCEVCGGWFKEGNEFRNHVCQVETYPSEDNMIETYPSEDNMMETYPSEDNIPDPVPQG